jgi:conjugal transfer pilus assembly protein TraB
MKHNLIQNTAISLGIMLSISTVCSASDAPETKVRAVLKSGLIIPTSIANFDAYQPILMNLVDEENLHLKLKTPFKDAALLGRCFMRSHSNRVTCHIQTLSFVKPSGEVVEKSVEGFLMDEDGKEGLKGKPLDQQNEAVREAYAEDVLASLKRDAVSTSETNNGKLTAVEKLRALGKEIERLEAMTPSVELSAGRVVNVVFKNVSDLDPTQQQNKKTNVQ